MSAGVLLDTGFLITLVNAQRPHHSIARSYYLHLLNSGMPMLLSSIAASEFAIKQPLTASLRSTTSARSTSISSTRTRLRACEMRSGSAMTVTRAPWSATT